MSNDDDPTKPDLSLVDTDWMVAEIMNRYHAILIVREAKPDADSADLVYDWSGGVSTCIGLAVRASDRLRAIARKAAERADADEDADDLPDPSDE